MKRQDIPENISALTFQNSTSSITLKRLDYNNNRFREVNCNDGRFIELLQDIIKCEFFY
jgi:hypothetical protein